MFKPVFDSGASQEKQRIKMAELYVVKGEGRWRDGNEYEVEEKAVREKVREQLVMGK